MRRIGSIIIAVTLMLSGCGSVDWFPAYHRLPTTPDQFTFAAKSAVAISTPVTSDAITVAGLADATTTSPISITGPTASNSQYAINGGTATATAGTVKNGDKVTVTHTSAATLGTTTVSTLSIGNINGTFTSVTQTVKKFEVTKSGAAGAPVFSGAIQLNLVSGLHIISITNGFYSFDNFVSASSAQQTITINDLQNIYLRNTAAAGSGNKVVTVVTIDGVESTFTTTTL